MANLSQIKTDSNWGDASSSINKNFAQLNTAVEAVKNATVKFKGYFSTEEALKSAYPSPKNGDTAWVGTPYPGKVYEVNSGKWTNTNTEPETGEVKLDDYYTKTEIDKQNENVNNQFTEQDKKFNELNISFLYPSNGIDGSDKYSLEAAIAQVPDKYHNAKGFKVTFINNETNKSETWVYKDGTFTSPDNWTKDNESIGSDNKYLYADDGLIESIPLSDFTADNTAINSENGGNITSTGNSISNFIKIPENTTNIRISCLRLKKSTNAGIAIYDNNKNFITGYSGGNYDREGTLIYDIKNIPINSYYIRTTVQTDKKNEAYCYFRNDYKESGLIIENAENIDKIKKHIGELPKNIITTFTNGRGIIADSNSLSFGAGKDNSMLSYSDYVLCSGYNMLDITLPILENNQDNFGLVFYNNSKKPISGIILNSSVGYSVEKRTIKIDSNISYFRTTFFTDSKYGDFNATLRTINTSELAIELADFKQETQDNFKKIYTESANIIETENLKWDNNYILNAQKDSSDFGNIKLSSNSGVSTCDFLEIPAQTTEIIISVFRSNLNSDVGCVIYDSSKKPIKGYTHQYRKYRDTFDKHIYNIPADAAYIRTSVLTSDIGKFVFKKNISGAGVVYDLQKRQSKSVLNAVDYGAENNKDIKFILFAMLEDLTNDQESGVIYVPAGTYLLNDQVFWKSNISLIGDGQGVTIFKPVGNKTAFVGDDLENIGFERFTIDGELQSNAAYTPLIKGFYQQRVTNAIYRDLHIINIFSTGLGVDHFISGIIENIICYNCGRGADLNKSAPGASGIGVGTGGFNRGNETLTISNCHCIECKQYGIFVETQMQGDIPTGVSIIGCTAEKNRVGFGVAGCESAIFIACTAYNNHQSGFAYNAGTMGISSTGKRPKFIGCIAKSNGTSIPDGYPEHNGQQNGFGWYVLNNYQGMELISCNSIGNLKSGIEVVNGITDLCIEGGEISENGEHGINLNGNISKFRISPTIIQSNTGDGIRINATLTKGFIKNTIVTSNNNGINRTDSGNIGDTIINDNFVYNNTTSDNNIVE